ncbi:MAG: hypothetical protein M1820_010463 [Bogoriella megaspora]|nr:MAG: hypothetical protein M1820_010463 [Bogoriella megaspora]
MAMAISTTKRKFDKLLENFSYDSPSSIRSVSHLNGSTTSLSSSETPTQDTSPPAAKRLRGSPKSIRELAQERLAAKRAAAAAAAIAATEGTILTEKRQPNYVPWSQEAFLARLKTFADVKLWTPKPDAISEVEWAKRGWRCDGEGGAINTVACKGGCEKRVSVRLRPKRKDAEGNTIEGSEDYSVDVDEALVEKYKELLAGGHEEECHWRKAGCKADIYYLPLARPSYWQTGLKVRYESLVKIGSQLPERTSTPEGSEDVDKLIEKLPKDFFGTDKPQQAAVKFALYGWKAESIGKTALVGCPHCFSRVALWMYKRNEEKLLEGDGDDSFLLNVADSHRDYCPWRNGKSQASPGVLEGMTGWQVLQRMIKTSRRRSSEARSSPEPPQTPRPVTAPAPATVSTPIVNGIMADDLVRQSPEEVAAADKARLSKLAKLRRMISFKSRTKK